MARGMADPEGVRENIRALTLALDQLIAQQPCVTLKQLAVNGGDLLALGYPKGPALGQALQKLLDAVLEGELDNDREALLSKAALFLHS